MIICCKKQEAVVQGPNGRAVFLTLTHNWFSVAFCLCCGCLAPCLTWTRRKAGCSSPWRLRWDYPCLTTSHIQLPWWQHWIMWQLCPWQQRRQSTTPTSLCRTSACCCFMRTLGSPGEIEDMGPWSDPGQGKELPFSEFGWEGTGAGAFSSGCRRTGQKTWLIYFLQSPLLGSSAPGSQCAFLYVSSLEAALCQGQNPGHFQPHLHYVLHTSEYRSVLLNWWESVFYYHSWIISLNSWRESLDQISQG